MAITKEQVWAAAEELAAEGLRPTLEAVRQRIGGSYTTIGPALNEWKARQAEKASPVREPPPAAVAERLAEVWGVALDLANALLAAEREALARVRAEMEAERSEATELADRLAEQLEALQSRLAVLEASEQAARLEAGELRSRLAAAETRASELERRVEELRDALEAAQRQAGDAREEAARLSGQLEAIKEHAAALLARIPPPADAGGGKGAGAGSSGAGKGSGATRGKKTAPKPV